MNNLVWNDGLSVGVDSIDADHKKLLSLIAELSEAIASGHANEVLENIFLQLEKYVVIHFTREEALMRKCNYPDLENHIKQHQAFIKKVPELKNKLLTADSIKVSQEVNLFLYNWLMNHIVDEDLNFAQQVYEYGLSDNKQDKSSLLRCVIDWLSRYFTLNIRLAITAIFPILALFGLSFFILWNSSKEYLGIQSVLDFNPIVNQINVVTHQLQMERGLSMAYLGANNNNFHVELIKQREITDQVINSFKQKLNTFGKHMTNEEMLEHFIQSRKYFYRLAEQRKLIDLSEGSDSTFRFYSGFIAELLAIPETATHYKMSSKMAHNIDAFGAIINLKEALGLERALGVLAFEQGYLSKKQLHDFILLLGQQVKFKQDFLHAATPQKKSWLALDCDQDKIHSMEQEIYLSNENKLITNDGQHWFELLTCQIDELKALSDLLMDDLDVQASTKTHHYKYQLYFIIIVLSSILVLTLFLFWLLRRSIIFPIRHLTHAIHDLAFGNKKIQINEKYAHDELGELLESYEKCRRRLLQAEISSTIDFSRLGVELEYNTSKKEYYEKLSSIDPLTGTFNRRKLNALADIEISRLSRFNRPLSLMMLDIDHFKKINDSYGHAIGDDVLIEFCQICQQHVRNIDFVARIGGEEFVVLMPETDLKQAYILAERIRAAIDEHTVIVDDEAIRFTVSIGVAEWSSSGCKYFDDLLECADQRLYAAKQIGRNRVI